jgi:hypothetical protein
MDSFGHIYDEKDSKYWYTQTYVSPYIKEAMYRMKRLMELERKGCITNLKHKFEE